MSLDWSPLARLIEDHDRFLVTSHVRPDGDALGSQIGMVGLLRQKGKDVRAVNPSPLPPRYDFLDPTRSLFEHFAKIPNPATALADREALVILDLSSWGQLGPLAEFVAAFPGPRLIIDHHVSQDDLGATVIKDTTAEATGTLVLRAVRALGATLTPEIATGLLTAIAMDTGWFRHPSTKPRTLRDVAELLEAGAPIDQTYRELFERNSLGRLRMMGEALAAIQSDCGGSVVWTSVSRADFERTGAIPPDTEDLVDYTVTARGAVVGLLFIEQDSTEVKASIRTRDDTFHCARVAARFGGGGHRAAAGATLPGPLDAAIAQLLDAVRQELAASSPSVNSTTHSTQAVEP